MEVSGQRLSVGEVIFAAVFVIASSLTWFSAVLLSESYERSPVPFLTGIIIAALSFAVLMLIEPTSKLLVRVVFVVGFLLAIPIAFLGDVTSIAVGVPVASLAALFAVLATWRARRIKEALASPLLVHTARRTLPLYFVGVSMVLTTIVFISPIASDAITTPIPESFVRISVKMLDPLVRPMLGVSVQEDIDTIIRRGIDMKIERMKKQLLGGGVLESIDIAALRGIDGVNFISGDSPSLESTQIDEFIIDDTMIARERVAYGGRLGIEINGDDDIADIVIKLIDKQAQRFEEQLRDFYKIGFFISAFFLFQLLSWPFSWLTIGLSAITLWLLRIGNMANIAEVPAIKEKLVWGGERMKNGGGRTAVRYKDTRNKDTDNSQDTKTKIQTRS